MSSFWAKKLGTAAPAAPRQAPYQGQLPRGMGQDHDQTVQHYMDRRQVVSEPQFTGRPQEQAYDGQQGPPVDENGMVYYLDAVKAYKGTRQLREENAKTGDCPNCGSYRYFSRASEGKTTQNGFVPPRAQCFECGYPNEQGALGISAKAVGSALPSRQGAAPSMALAAQMS